MPLDVSPDRAGDFQARLAVCLFAVSVFFFFLFSRLFYLQVVKGNYFRLFSTAHTFKEIRIPATRGVLFDRNRVPIAENRPSFDLTIIPQHVRNFEKVKSSLFKVAGLDPRIVEFHWAKRKSLPSFFPLVIASDFPYEQSVRIRAASSVLSDEEDLIDMEGVEIIHRPLRSYPQGPVAPVTLGYLGEVSERDLARLQKEAPGRYVPGDRAGASGIERYWETELRGRDGYVQKIVDAGGRELVLANDEFASFLSEEKALHGHNLVLSIDSRLQKFAEGLFEGEKGGSKKSGGLVALDPRNGEVLAMVSQPAYDPTLLVSNVSSDRWTGLVADPRKLFLNRAIQGTYPPGSTYKIVTAIAGLEEGVIRPDETISCGGGLHFGGRLFRCWRGGGHGAISVHRAISESCDTFFYQVGLRLGVDRIAKYAALLGFGQKTGIDLDGEKGGLIPTAEWKLKTYGQEWQAGENLSIAVGQGYDTVTPLQNALLVAQVGSGRKLRPHLLKFIEDEDGTLIERYDGGEDLGELEISRETLEIVRGAMADTLASPAGTAHGSRSSKFRMAGKTGTAQVMSEEAKTRVRGLPTGDHAWFVVFAPVEDPRIAVGVVVEHGGFGASAAAPIAKKVIEEYLADTL